LQPKSSRNLEATRLLERIAASNARVTRLAEAIAHLASQSLLDDEQTTLGAKLVAARQRDTQALVGELEQLVGGGS
jgi:hypothetical protein